MPGEIPDATDAHNVVPAGIWYGLVSVAAMLLGAFARNVMPTVPPLITALGTNRQQRDEEARKLRAEWAALVEMEKRRAERAEAEKEHYESEAYRLVGAHNELLQKAKDAHLQDCPSWAAVRPYAPPRPPDATASHD
jgi:hypothetical protein